MYEKILVIGGKGYIGSKLVEILNTELMNVEIIVIDSNEYTDEYEEYNMENVLYLKTKYANLEKSFYDYFDVIVFLAHDTKYYDITLQHVSETIHDIEQIINNLKSRQMFIYASSASIYEKTHSVVTETHEISKVYNYYDWSTQTIEKLLEKSNKHYYVLRLGLVGGYSTVLNATHTINKIMYYIQKNKLKYIDVDYNDTKVPILGIYDTCHVILKIIKKGKKECSGVYNIASFNTTLYTIVDNISRKLNIKVNYKQIKSYDPLIFDKLEKYVYDYHLDCSKFNRIFGYTFKDTIDTIIDSFTDKWSYIIHVITEIYKIPEFTTINECIICKDTTLKLLLDLGNQPLKNRYHHVFEYIDKYPLQLYVCDICFNMQSNLVINPNLIYKNNKKYITHDKKIYLKDYLLELKDFIIGRFLEERMTLTSFMNLSILHIGCGNKYLLDICKEYYHDFTTVGVDPNKQAKKGVYKHDIYTQFFDKKLVEELEIKYKAFDIIFIDNVLESVVDPGYILELCKSLMHENSIIIAQTRHKNMITDTKFIKACHEQISYFNINSMKILCQKKRLILNYITEAHFNYTNYPIHNHCYRQDFLFEIRLKKTKDSNVIKMLLDDIEKDTYSLTTYQEFGIKSVKFKNEFHNLLLEYYLENKPIIGFCNNGENIHTLLNFCQDVHIGKYISYIIDENIERENKLTPGTNIQIIHIDRLKMLETHDILYFIIFDYENYHYIVTKLKKYLKDIFHLKEIYNKSNSDIKNRCTVTFINLATLGVELYHFLKVKN